MLSVMFVAFAIFQLVIGMTVADTSVPLWPLPNSVNIGNGSPVTLHSSFKFALSTQFKNKLADAAVERYRTLIGESLSSAGTLQVCNLSVNDATIPEIINADETYTVSITSEGACDIHGANLWGLLRGLETFTQLLVRDNEAHTVLLRNTPVTIKDTSRYGHRGLLIDTSRHYISYGQIKKVIDSLPTNK